MAQRYKEKMKQANKIQIIFPYIENNCFIFFPIIG